MDWTTLRSASASHLRRVDVTMSSVFLSFLERGVQPSRVSLLFASELFTTASRGATLRL